MRSATFGVLALGAVDGATLVLLPPHVVELVHGCTHLRAWLAAGPDRAIAELARAGLWCAAAWLALGLLAACASRLPGATGRVAAACCRLLLPAVLRRLLAGSAGLSVLLTPALAAAHPAPHPHPHAGARTLAAPVVPSIATNGSAPIPANHRRQAARHVAPHIKPPVAPTTRPQHPTGETVRVRPGDSLWLLASTRLGRHAPAAEIAAYWPRWYAANRAVIGNNPSVITPGEVLNVPAPTPQETP